MTEQTENQAEEPRTALTQEVKKVERTPVQQAKWDQVTREQKEYVEQTQAVDIAGPWRWRGAQWDQYDMEDWLQSFGRLERNIHDARATNLMIQERTYGSNGLPQDWDYKTSPVGPFGEPLPPGADGWDPFGKPDFGPGIEGWYKRMAWNWTDIKSEEEMASESLLVKYGTVDDRLETSGKLWEEDKGAWAKFHLGMATTGFSNIVDKFTESPVWAVRQAANFAETGVSAALELFNVPSMAVQTLVGPVLMSSADMIDRAPAMDNPFSQGVLDFAGKIPVVRELSTIMLGHILAFGGGQYDEMKSLTTQYREIEDNGWGIMGSRIAYTLAQDEMLRQEYVRRAQAGEPTHLLALEMGDLWIQASSEIFLDPLILVGAVLKASRATKLARAGRAVHATPIDELATWSDDMARMASAGSAIDVADEGMDIIRNIQRGFSNVSNGIDDLAQSRRLIKPLRGGGRYRRMLNFTANGKRAVVGRRVGDHLNVMLSHFGDSPDGFLDYMHGMALMASDDADDVAKGLRLVTESGAPMEMAFSQAGVESGVFLRRTMFNPSTGKFTTPQDLLKGVDNLDEFIPAVTKRLDTALEGVFPTVHEQIAKNDKFLALVDEFGEGHDEVVNYLAKNPYADDIISKSNRLIATADMRMQKYFYGPSMRFFNFFYMRMNPAYAWRNRLNNAFTMFVDQGAGPAVRSFFSPQGALDDIEKSLGFIPSSATRGFGPKAGVRGLEGAYEAGDFWNWAKKSQNWEAQASAHIYRKSVQDTFKKGLKEGVAIPERAMLSGFGNDEVDDLIRIAQHHRGNTAEVTAELRRMKEGINAGRIPELYMPPEDIQKLKDLGLYDEVTRISREADNIDDAHRMIDDAIRRYDDEARAAARESGVLGTPRNQVETSEVADTLAVEEHLTEAGGQGDEVSDLMSRKIQSDRETIRRLDEQVRILEDEILVETTNQAWRDVAEGRITEAQVSPVARKMKDELFAPYKQQAQQITDDTVRQADHLREACLGASDKSFGIGRRPADSARDDLFFEIWNETGLPSRPRTDFDSMKPKKFRRMIWEEYFPKRNNIWVTRREQLFNLGNQQMNSAGQMLQIGPQDMMGRMNDVYRANNTARLFDRAELLDDGTAVVRLGRSELQESFITNVGDLYWMDSVGGVVDPGRIEHNITNMQGMLDRLSLRPERSIELAYADIGEQGREALRMIAGDRKSDQYEALRIMLDREAPLYSRVRANEFYDEIVGPGINEFSVGRQATSNEPILFNINTEQGTGESAFTYWLREQQAKGDTHFLTTTQLPDELDEAGEVVKRGGEGFFKRMEEKGYIERVDDYLPPVGDRAQIDQPPYPRYRINELPEEVGDRFAKELVAPDPDGFMNTPARNAFETQPEAHRVLDQVKTRLGENWGDVRQVTMSPQKEKAYQAWVGEMQNRMTTLKAEAVEVANATRDFILLDYEARTALDNFFSYIWPYQFWYRGTYRNWASRLAHNPAIGHRYYQYRSFLEKRHAGMPDWWKYNINLQEDLLGIQTDNPIFFNLEATLNPLNGLTGVDFNDPRRRLDWYSKLADDLGKFGPSIWTPYALGIAMSYHIQGKDEAAGRWAGRLSPMTRTVRDLTALTGYNKGKGLEIDPLVHLFSGGIGPYEEPRIGRMLSQMVDEGAYPEAAIIDAAYKREGPIWDEAWARAIHQRAPSLAHIASPFFLGVGFKPRTQTDMEIDRFYSEMYGLMGNKDNLSPENYRKGWDDLEQKYPFMTTLLLSRKTGDERDEAYAWSVLNRIPPGMTDEITEMAGIQTSDVTNFYETNGNLNDMSEGDRMRFMAAVMDIGALLDLPDAPTKAEWDAASEAYKAMRADGEYMFGDDIWEKVDVFYGKPDDQKDAYIRANPDVEQALDWQDAQKITNPALAPYYSSIDQIERYLKGNMYDQIEDELGDDIWDKWEVWGRLKDRNPADAKRYYRDHRDEFDRYHEIKDEYEPHIASAMVRIASMIPAAKPPNWRGAAPEDGFESTTSDTEAWIRSEVLKYSSGRVMEEYTPPPSLPVEYLLSQPGGATLLRLLTDDDELPPTASLLLEDLGITEDEVDEFQVYVNP